MDPFNPQWEVWLFHVCLAREKTVGDAPEMIINDKQESGWSRWEQSCVQVKDF